MAKDLYLVVSRGVNDLLYSYEAEHVDMGIARTAAKSYAQDDQERKYYVAQIMCGFQSSITVNEI